MATSLFVYLMSVPAIFAASAATRSGLEIGPYTRDTIASFTTTWCRRFGASATAYKRARRHEADVIGRESGEVGTLLDRLLTGRQ